MKRIIAIGVLFSYIPIYVAPLWGLNNQLTIKTKLNKTQYKTYTDYKIDIEKITENATELTTELVEETTETTTEETYIKGFVTTKVNIRENNSINSSVISQLNFNEEVEYYIFDSDWSKVKLNNLTGYIKSDLDLVLENNIIIPCILADQKADKHTNSSNTITVHDGSLAEFIVDAKALSKSIKLHGDISFACKEWNSSIKTIKIYEKNILKGGE